MNTTKTAFALAIGAAFTASLALTEAARAADNPFSMQNLSQGYLLASAAGKVKDGKCGEGKCGDKNKAAKIKDGKCGEGKCGDKKNPRA